MMGVEPTGERAPLPERVPTLTEVIDADGHGGPRWNAGAADWPSAEPASVDHAVAIDAEPFVAHGLVESTVAEATVDEQDSLTQAVLAALARVDAVDDARLRIALQPLIARFTDGLVAAVRTELASSLREMSVNQNDSPPAPASDLHGAVAPSA